MIGAGEGTSQSLPPSHQGLTEKIVGVTVRATTLSVAAPAAAAAATHLIGKAQDLSPTVLP